MYHVHYIGIWYKWYMYFVLSYEYECFNAVIVMQYAAVNYF